ncbi:MAG: PAS domain-containing protein [Actinomycetota bacterium]|nr:PAS domain-containing protein [Actinomycetota bacterium]
MRAGSPTPTGEERTFGEDEIIVSKTDTRGFVTYANDVFLKVSRYEEHELVGHAHNVIRHPDMPRSVFKLLWSTIEEGREIFAYVLNLASDGAHYWVFAHVTPSYGPRGELVGYHSNRRRPHPAAVREVALLYEQLLAEERRHTGPKESMAASGRLLHSVLDERNETYEEFVWGVANRAGARG